MMHVEGEQWKSCVLIVEDSEKQVRMLRKIKLVHDKHLCLKSVGN